MIKHVATRGVLILALLMMSGQAASAVAPHSDGALASVYYVDQGHPGANDSNDGSEDHPWLTIQKAADTVDPGDTVYVKTGTYDERVLINRDGTPAAKIAFKALPRRSVQVLHGFNISADAIRVEGFDITHDAGGWLGGGIWMAGHDTEIVDNYIHDVPGAGVLTSWAGDGLWDDVYVADNYIYGCNQGVSTVSGDNWLVENNEIERLIRPPSGSDADYVRFFGTNHVIRGNYLHGTRPEEIGTSHVDCFQTYDDNGEQAHNVLFEHNQCLDFVHQVFMMEGNGTSHTNIVIRYNVFQGFTAWGVAAENIRDVHIYNNTWVGVGIGDPATFSGVGFRHGSTGIVKNNIFTGIRGPYWHDGDSSYESGHNLTFECLNDPDPGSPTDLLDIDPLFVAPGDILGPDGTPWTADDGLQLQPGSPAIDGGEGGTFIGAYAFVPDLVLQGRGASATIYLDWTVNVTLPATTTWRIDYYTATAPFTATDPFSITRSYVLTDVLNYQWYTVTLTAVGTNPVLSDTVRVMPTDIFVYLPLARKQ